MQDCSRLFPMRSDSYGRLQPCRNLWSVFGCTLLRNHLFFAQSGTSSNFPRNKIALARISQAKSVLPNQPFLAPQLAASPFYLDIAGDNSPLFCEKVRYTPVLFPLFSQFVRITSESYSWWLDRVNQSCRDRRPRRSAWWQ